MSEPLERRVELLSTRRVDHGGKDLRTGSPVNRDEGTTSESDPPLCLCDTWTIGHVNR